MQKLIEEFPKQMQKAVEIGESVSFSPLGSDIQNIVIAGLGGSGIGGNWVASLVANELKVPVLSSKNYDIPAFVSEKTLVIGSSFSGNTEETLSALSQAEEKGAKICIISSGGKAIELAKNKGYDFVQVPNEAPSPRAFIGYSFTQLLYVFYQYGLISDGFKKGLTEGIQLIQDRQGAIREKAEELASLFLKKLPIIYSEDKFLPIITRFQQQINENSKQLCHTNVLPEMNHNELVGWELDKTHYEHYAVLLVRSSFENERVKMRFDICEPIWSEKATLKSLGAEGESFIAQNLFLLQVFDWTSLYLAAKNGVDAFPVDIIVHLKGELAKK